MGGGEPLKKHDGSGEQSHLDIKTPIAIFKISIYKLPAYIMAWQFKSVNNKKRNKKIFTRYPRTRTNAGGEDTALKKYIKTFYVS